MKWRKRGREEEWKDGTLGKIFHCSTIPPFWVNPFSLVLIATILLPIISSCENDIEKIHALSRENNYPVRSAFDVELLYTDSTKLKARVDAKELYLYTHEEEPYYEFPAGFVVYLYDDEGNQTFEISGDYGRTFNKQQLWEARGNVIAKNVQTGQTLYTEQMFWDQKDEKIYSDKFTRYVDENGESFGEKGFEANQSFSKWRLIDSKGTVNVKED